MSFEEITSLRNNIITLIKGSKIYAAINGIRSLIAEDESWDLTDELDRIETSYKYMIQYFVAGTVDNQQERILCEIVESLYAITDKVYCRISAKVSGEQYFLTQKFVVKSLEQAIEEFKNSHNNLELYGEVEAVDRQQLLNLTIAEEDKGAILFDFIWTKFPLTGSEVKDLADLFDDENVPINLKSMLVAALYLSGSKFYQEHILLLLLSLYSKHQDIGVTALCCLLILMYKYDYRVNNSQKLKNAWTLLSENETFRKDVRSIYFLLIRSRDTEKLTKRVQDEIMPEIMKISPTIINKFKGAQYIKDVDDLEGNPEWRNILENSDLSKKIEELNSIQLSGADIFMGTFSKLKSFPFFRKISNWFMPFHKGNSVVLTSFTEKEEMIKSILMNINYLCNSDKYSFCLSFGSIPKAQRDMMMSHFDAQNAAIKEMQNASLPDPCKSREDIANRFIQDLFRFMKLYSYRQEFYDPFDTTLDLKTVDLILDILTDADTLTYVGEYFMKNEHYNESIECFERIMQSYSDFDSALIQKMGFCHQCMKHYDKAIESYLKYELFNPDDLWNLRHIATCFKSLGNPQKALEYYRRAESLSPDNLSISLNIGHCFLEMGKIEEALKAYYKVDYLDNSHHRAIRPIAWCLFLIGNYESSASYYEKVLSDNPSAHDFLNIGHLNMCLHNYVVAADYYRKSITAFGNDFKTFMEHFENDKEYLTVKGIKQVEIGLILDKISYDCSI